MRKRLDKAGSGQAEANEIAFECLNEIIVICSGKLFVYYFLLVFQVVNDY
jgi:hypothetical protein